MTFQVPSSRKTPGAVARLWLLAAICVVLFLIALSLDRTVATAVHDSRFDTAIRGRWFAELVKVGGTFGFTAAVAGAGLLLRRLSPAQSLFIALAGVMSGINGLIKWIVGRTRPFKLSGFDSVEPLHFEPFWRGIDGLFHQKDLCFPSGHACTAFALATAVALVQPKWGWAFIPLAILVGVERILENAHYFSDVVGAAAVGAGGTLLVRSILQRWFAIQPKPSASPVIQPPNSEPAALHS